MKILLYKYTRAMSVAIIIFSVAAMSIDSSPSSKTDLKEIYGQWKFMEGVWDVKIQTRQKNGTMADYKQAGTYVIAGYLADKITFQQQFIVPDQFFSTQIKAYHLKKKRWINKFVNSKRQRWTTTYSYWKKDRMITIVPKGYSGNESYWSKEIDSEITENRFVKRVFHSEDQGKNWEKSPRYILTFMRRK